jgi:hypothetical protein
MGIEDAGREAESLGKIKLEQEPEKKSKPARFKNRSMRHPNLAHWAWTRHTPEAWSFSLSWFRDPIQRAIPFPLESAGLPE